ncbi:uncharacterized protein LOC134541540 [Bacillus rossius redtenbacheri]|uniref:uncharacterized protein LOC134541540 n=1 Tax=Bacillus rossius redtenbacheri TaxID=93214 RepID=UPI002FDD77A6
MTFLSMNNQRHEENDKKYEDLDESESDSSLDIFPASPVFKTPLIGMKKEITHTKLSDLNLDDLFPNVTPRKQEDPTEASSTNEILCSSPFRISCFSPILSTKPGPSREIPESLGPLLSKDDVSWTSSLATPRAHNQSWTHANSSGRKTASADNSDFLLSCDVGQSAIFKQSDVSNFLDASTSRHLEESHNALVQSSNETVLNEIHSKCVSQVHDVNDMVCKQNKCLNGSLSDDEDLKKDQIKHGDERSFLKEGDKFVIARRLFDPPDTDMKEIDYFINDSEVERMDMSLDITNKFIHVVDAPECVCDRQGVCETVSNLQIDSQNKLPLNDCNTQEFFNNLSFGTLDEVFQATEILGSTESSPLKNLSAESSSSMICVNVNCNPKDNPETSKITNKKFLLSRTSTPLNSLNKKVNSFKEMNRKKIKFVSDVEHTPSLLDVEAKESDTNFFPEELSKIVAQEMTSKEHFESPQNSTPCSKINSIKRISNNFKSFIYAHSSSAKTSMIAHNSVLDLADLLKEAQILEDGEILGVKASVLTSNEQKKWLENSSCGYSKSDFVSFSRFCKLNDSNSSVTTGSHMKKNLMSDTFDCHYFPTEHSVLPVSDSACELNDKSGSESPILVSSRSKRLRIEDGDVCIESETSLESGDFHDQLAKRICNQRTATPCLESVDVKVPVKTLSICDKICSCGLMGAECLSKCLKLKGASKDSYFADVMSMLDLEEPVPKLKERHISMEVESKLSGTDDMSAMDVTDTQLIAAGETMEALLQLKKNGNFSHWQSGLMKQGVQCRDKVSREKYEKAHDQEDKGVIQINHCRNNVGPLCKENHPNKNCCTNDSCLENYANLLDSDTVDQFFEDSSELIEKNRSNEGETKLPRESVVTEGMNEDNISEIISVRENACIDENIPIKNSEQNDLRRKKMVESNFTFVDDFTGNMFSTDNKNSNSINHSMKALEKSNTIPTGFLLASGKMVKVSKQAVEKAKSVFLEENIFSAPKNTNINLTKENVTSPYKNSMDELFLVESKLDTSIGIDINNLKETVSRDFAGHVENIYLETKTNNMHIPLETCTKISKEITKSDMKMGSENVNCSFASDTVVKSIKNLSVQCSSPFEKENEDSGAFAFGDNELMLKHKDINCGFSAASGNKLNFSKEAFKKSLSLILEDEIFKLQPKNLVSTIEKKLEVSYDTIGDLKAGKYLKCSERPQISLLSSIQKNEKCSVVSKSVSENVPRNCLFSTVSEKKADVSKEALNKAKMLFCEERMLESDNGENVGVSVQAVKKSMLNCSGESMLHTPKENYASDEEKGSISKPLMEIAKPNFSEVNMLKTWAFNCGFTTASGKKVTVSEQAMKTAQLLLLEENILEPKAGNVVSCKDNGKNIDSSEKVIKNAKSFSSEENMLKPKVESLLFSTASGNKVNFSEQTLKRAKLLFSEESMLESGVENLEFCTTSEKQMDFSLQALKKDELPFSEENISKTSDNHRLSYATRNKGGASKQEFKKPKLLSSEKSVSESIETNHGFSSANGKKINACEHSMKKAKLLFLEEKVETGSKNFGFSTASGKKVDVSERALKKAKKLFSEENTSETKSEYCGFSTASGKKVEVSEKALKKVKKLFSEENMSATKSESYGFSTASEKKVDVPNQAMKKAKLLFLEEGISETGSSGQGKVVPTSEVASKKAKVIFSEVSDLDPRLTNCGFSTASGKKINVSEHSIQKAKSLFLEESNSETKSEKCGFATASGKPVDVTKKALKKAESLFPDSVSEKRCGNYGFSTASGKESSVSKEALKKAKLLFSEEIGFVPTAYFGLSETSGNKASISEGSILVEGTLNDAVSIGKTKTVEVSKESLLTDNSKYLVSDPQVDFGSESAIRKIEPHIRSNVSSGVVCDAASVHDFFFGSEAMQSHSQTSNTMYKFEIDNNGLKSPVLQRNSVKMYNTQEDSTLDTHSSSSPVLRSKNSFIPIKPQSYFDHGKTAASLVLNKSTSKGVDKSLCSTKYLDDGKPVCGKSRNLCEITEFVSEINLSQEVNEQATALLMDDSNVPLWASSYVTGPDSSGDRFEAPRPVVSSDAGDVLPPVKFALGSHDRFLTKRSSKSRTYKTRLSITSSKRHDDLPPPLCSHHNEQQSATKKSTFKVPYKDTGQEGRVPVPSAIQPLRNTRKRLAFGTPFGREPPGVTAAGEEAAAEVRASLSGADVAAARAEAARRQELQVKSARKDGEARPCRGSHLVRKIRTRGEQVTWKEAAAGRLRGTHTTDQLLQLGIKKELIFVSAANAAVYRFSAWDFYSPDVCRSNVAGIAVGDGALLILDSAGFAGVEEVTRAFLSSPGVDPSLLPSEKWVPNHYRWIVWKLAATDRSFPTLFASRCLTPNNVMLQLKYRYDREIDHSERPALSRILQRDDAAGKRLVLCVANISKVEGNSKRDTGPYELELTDGWYSVMASVDHEMCRLIEAKVVSVGTKLITYGAELLNCDQGCLPLEAGGEVRLKLHTNSTRRARWHTKLGYHSCPGPLPVSLSSVLPQGGLVSCVTVVVARVYPPVYVQRVTDGKSVVRNERTEERAAVQFEKSRQETVERVLSQVQAQLRQESEGKSEPRPRASKLTSQMTGEDLCRLLEHAPDPASLQTLLSTEQLEAVMSYQEKRNEEMRRELESRMQAHLQDITRNVVPLLKVRCTDAINPESEKYATLSVWRASEDVQSILKEGALLKLFNVSATGNRYRGLELQLSASKQTAYQPVARSVPYPRRKATPLGRASEKDFCPPFGELDVVGVVVCVASAAGCDEAYLASEDGAVLCVVFWGGVKEFGFEDILAPQNKVAASNLQWRPDTSPGNIPRTYAWECSSFCLHPRSRHLQEALKILGQRMEGDIRQFITSCKEKIDSLQQQKARGFMARDEAAAIVPKGFVPTAASKVPKMTDEVQPPSSAERKIMKLELYGEAPPLSPIILPCPRGALRRAFRVPQRREASPKPADSPPLSLESQSEDD